MKVAFIGIGNLGYALANRLQNIGFEVVVAHDNNQSDSVLKALKRNPNFTVLPVQKAIDTSELVFLATPFNASEKILAQLKFHGKTLVDCTNPVGAGISHGLESKMSGAERIQGWAKDANVVKAFSIYGFENLDPQTWHKDGIAPAMLMAGNNMDSKHVVAGIISELGFNPVDTGSLSNALHLEHMTLLWIKMVRAGGHPHFLWAYQEC